MTALDLFELIAWLSIAGVVILGLAIPALIVLINRTEPENWL